MSNESSGLPIKNYCLDCRRVAVSTCETRGHIVGTLGHQGQSAEADAQREPEQKRRVIITLTVTGSYGDAQAIQDAVGEAIDDELLGAIVTDVVNQREIANVDWIVK